MSPWQALCSGGISHRRWPALGMSLRDYQLGWKHALGTRNGPPARQGSGQKVGEQEAPRQGRGATCVQQGGGGQGLESRGAAAAAQLGAQEAEALTQGHHTARLARPRRRVPGSLVPRGASAFPERGGPPRREGGEDAEPLAAFSSTPNASTAQAGTLQRLPLPSASQTGHPMEGTRLSPRTPVTREPESWS